MAQIKDFQPGSYITDHPCAVTFLVQKQGKNGPYLEVTLCDSSGQIAGKVWSDSLSTVDLLEGQVFLLSGKVGEWNGNKDFTINKAIHAPDLELTDHLAKVPTMIFDIETVGQDFDGLGEWEQEYVLTNLEKNTDEEEAKTKLGLYALYGFIQSIGITDHAGRGVVLALTDQELTPENKDFSYETFTEEKELIKRFWELTKDYDRFVTYNGRGFDWPFLVIRSGINHLKIPMEIDDYNKTKFVDLADKFKQGRQFKLEALCRAFGITNPKQPGVSGLYVSKLYHEGNHQAIADYVARDAVSTHELYHLWHSYLTGHLNF